MADSIRDEIEQLILDPKVNPKMKEMPPKFWDMVAALSNIECVELIRVLLVTLAKRSEGEASVSYSPELQMTSVKRIIGLFAESVQ
jgi:hypothetical protein